MENKTSANLKIVTEDGFDDGDIKETILEYGENFLKLFQHSGENTSLNSFAEVGRIYKRSHKIWNNSPDVDEYVGWVNLRDGVYAPKRKEMYDYVEDDLIVAEVDNGYYYKCVEKGKTSATSALLLTSEGEEFYDVQADEWRSEYNYSVGDMVMETSGSEIFYYTCETSGLSGAGEPAWGNTAIGTALIDGSVVWRKEENVKWKVMESSANFRGFGKIE